MDLAEPLPGALLMSVGPSAEELPRLHDFLAALWHWEPAVKTVVLIDDALQSRKLEEIVAVPPGVRIHSLVHPRKGVGSGVWGGLTEGVLRGLDWLVTQVETEFILKIDTDALVIGPFAEKARQFLEAHPRVAMFGLYDRLCSGEPRSFDPWHRAMRHFALPFYWHREFGRKNRKLRWHLSGEWGEQRRILRQARRQGYRWGEHCLGGAYLLRSAAVRDLQAQGLLQYGEFWRVKYISEDVLVGAYLKAAGWDLANCASEGEIFGIAYRGIPFSPAELIERGYSITHSLKNDQKFPEEEIRRFFQARLG